MRIGRAIVIPAVLALSVAGSVLSSSVIPAAVGHAPSVHVQAGGSSVVPTVFYHT
jgi:hypothetical protein